MIRKIKNIQDTVRMILRDVPETRDDDRLLILKVWAQQNPNLRDEKITFREFSFAFLRKSYVDPESIRRSRQLIQRKFPHLMGKNRIGRQEAEKEMRDDINGIVFGPGKPPNSRMVNGQD